MTTGHEKLHRLNDVLNTFEEAVVAREHKGLTQSKVALQQETDRARRAVVTEVVDLVTKARIES